MHPLVRELGARLRSFVRSPHVWGVTATLVVVLALFLLPHTVHALDWQTYLAGAFAWVLGLIVNFLGKIISVLIYILMGFLQYNGFADAPPVMMGWVIIRDLMNMVFIVVLIISAIATILNYETSDLHVKNVLPKLIGAAVLINFSKMIVGILVDVSQVVMLTFVNAFQASGVGNFSQLLGLPSFTQLSDSTGNSAAAIATSGGTNTTNSTTASAEGGNIILDVLLAYMLAMAMLVISIGVILIMILFTVARIVGIWVLLIVSPAAFLATSLPKKLQKIFGSLAHDFWEKLTAFLVGGPTMAFFLWLAFATVRSTQQMTGDGGVATRLGLFNRNASPITQNGILSANSVISGSAQQGTNFFLSRVGNADGIASFIVGVALMVIGLEQAVRASSNASSLLGKYAGSIASGAKDTARWLAGRPIATPWNFIDRRAKLTDKAASALALVPGLNTLSGGKIGNYANYRKKELDQMAKEDMALYGNMSGIFKKAKGSSIRTWAKLPVLGTEADRKAALGLSQNQFSDAFLKGKKRELSAEYEHELEHHRPVDRFTGDPIDDDELKNQAKARASGTIDFNRREGFKNAMKIAKDLHDYDTVGKMEEEADKNPSLWKNEEDRARYNRAIKKMSDEDFEKNDELTTDGDAMLTRAEQAGAITVDKATGAITAINKSNFDQMVANMPKAAKRIRAVQASVEGHAVGGVVAADAAKEIRSSAFLQDASKMTSRVYNGSTGERLYSPAEASNRAGLRASFGGAGNGRAAPGTLDAAARAQIDTAFNTTNIGMKELIDIDSAVSHLADSAIPNYVASRISTELGHGAWAAPADVQAAMDTVAKAGEQMKDLDDRSQSVIIESLTASGQIQQMAERLQDMTEYQQEQLLNMARQAQELSRSTATTAAGTAVKDQAIAFLTQMRAHMTQNSSNVPTLAGGMRDAKAPPAFRAVLYKK